MKNHGQMLMIILIATLQLVALLMFSGVFFQSLHDSSKATAFEQTKECNHCYLMQAVGRIRSMSLENLEHGTADHQKLQTYVEKSQIPNNGFLVVVDDRSGKIVSHPELRHDSTLQNTTWREYCKAKYCEGGEYEDDILQPLLNDLGQESADGVVRYLEESHCMDVQRIPELGAVVLINQMCKEDHDTLVSIKNAKRLTFFSTLLVGFLCIGLTYVLGRNFTTAAQENENQLQTEVENRKSQLVKTQSAIIFGLAKLAESRDTDTGEHLERIRKYVTILANDLAGHFEEIDEEYIENLGLASSLHDIGKVGIPDAILLKPGRLTPEERSVMELHAAMGGECLEAIGGRLGKNDFLKMAREVAFWHHERWDGTGYPHQLLSTSIPVSARIVSVADVYDALTSRRPYKDPMSHEKSREIIVGGSGSQFDPDVVDAFLRHQEKFQAVAAAYNSVVEKPVAMLLAEKLAAANEASTTAT